MMEIAFACISTLGSPWMVLTCLEGSSEAVEWRMDRIQGAKREDTATC